MTVMTPGACSAAAVSMRSITPFAIVLKTIDACDEALDRILRGEPGRAGDLLDTVEAIDRLAEIAMAPPQLVLARDPASPARSARPLV